MPLIVKYNDQQADNHQIQEAVATRNDGGIIVNDCFGCCRILNYQVWLQFLSNGSACFVLCSVRRWSSSPLNH